MSPVIICIIIFFWIFIIIVAMSTKEKPEPEKSKFKAEEKPEPEIYLEKISDDLLYEILPGNFQNDKKFVSVSSTSFGIDFEEKSIMYFLRKVLRPRREHLGSSWYHERQYLNRKINDENIRLTAIYFDKNLNFKSVCIRLKIQNIGYSCVKPEDNVALADLKKFLTEKPTKITKEDYLVFSEKLQELERKEQDANVKEFVEQVFDRHTSYNKEAEKYNTEKAVPITSPEIFFNFCDLISYRVPSDLRAEVTNYLYILCEN